MEKYIIITEFGDQQDIRVGQVQSSTLLGKTSFLSLYWY